MFVILWEFEVKPGNTGCFEKAYGPNGQWVLLFQRDPHFRGTQLMRDPSRPLWYFTLDFWDSETDYRNFLAANHEPYQALDRSFLEFTLQERQISSFALNLPLSPAS